MKYVILFTTHILNDFIQEQIMKIHNEMNKHADFFVLLQVDNIKRISLPSFINVYPYTIESINALGYEPLNDTIIPGSNHFSLLQFYHDYPHYDYYWNIEYDVFFNGKWIDFFKWFEDKDIDFFSSHIATLDEMPEWEHWNDIKINSKEYNNISLFLKSFNPIYRLSNKALNCIDNFHQTGNVGHHELLIPTILNYFNFSIGDFGGNGTYICHSKELFYSKSNYASTWYGDSTMRFRPLFHLDEIVDTNRLYHPVKEKCGLYKTGTDLINEYNKYLDNSKWLRYKNLELSGFAVDEVYMLCVIKFLDQHNFKNILDLGCGQTTLVFSQYVVYNDSILYSVESDLKWGENFVQHHIDLKIKKYIHYYQHILDECSHYIGLAQDLQKQRKKFDFISIDGPNGYNCDYMSRVDILGLIINGLLSDEFVILFHDTNRLQDANTVNYLTNILDYLGIEYYLRIFHFGKGTTIITNIKELLVGL